jgi:hypothetical protein
METIDFVVPVIVCIAKKEEDYIEEFVKYHLALGFQKIYIYDNEDVPVYKELLHDYQDNIEVIHFPHNHYAKPVQYEILHHFSHTYLRNPGITHVAHIDIDEFIVLKKHKNICDFINEYIVGDCGAIVMNWNFFGSSNQTVKTNIPVTLRFTMCQENGSAHFKTLFKISCLRYWDTVHEGVLCDGYFIKNTNGQIIPLCTYNKIIDISVIQLNHYKVKTWPEFKYIRTRQRADMKGDINEDVEQNFKNMDINEVEDLTAYHFYKKVLDNSTKEEEK